MSVGIWIKRAGMTVSILLNLLLLSRSLLTRTEAPIDRIGATTREIEVGDFNGKGPYFKLPKGLVVRDASPQGIASIDLFEPHRFLLIVTSDSDGLVDYSNPRGGTHAYGELYSADWKGRHAVK